MKSDDRKESWVLILFGIIPVVWLALLTAPFFFDGLLSVIEKLPEAIQHPFRIQICKDSLKTVLLLLLAMEWESGFICLREEITGEAKNMVRHSGEMLRRSTRNTATRNLRQTS